MEERIVEFKCQVCGCGHKGYHVLHSSCPVCGTKNNDILETLWDPTIDDPKDKPRIVR